MFFLGQFDHNIDEKGRLTIPAQYRVLLADGAYITRGFERNLIVIPAKNFNSLYEKIKSYNITDQDTRDLERMFFGSAALLEMDKAGRILLPTFLRDAIRANGAVKLVGLGTYFEIWSADDWLGKETLINDDKYRATQFKGLNLSF